MRPTSEKRRKEEDGDGRKERSLRSCDLILDAYMHLSDYHLIL